MAGRQETLGRLFISYSRRNKEVVYPFAEALAAAGIDVWIDRDEIDPLDDFPARIRDGLAQCHALLAWYSPEYRQSSYCQKELTAAWICARRLTRNVLSRILAVNPESGVAHIALGDVGRQNYLAAPRDAASLATCVECIREKLAGLSGDFADVRGFAPPPWYPPPARQGSDRFVGRLREFWQIHTKLNSIDISEHENAGAVVQLRGLGGVGKSLLATEYARRFAAAYPGGIHWLRAFGFDPNKRVEPEARDRERRVQMENLAFLHEIDIRDKEDLRKVMRDLGRKLASGPPYLWIVDDLPAGLEQERAFLEWRAPSANGCTLITTRSRDYEGIGSTVMIDVLDPAPALELLTQVRKPQTGSERREAEGLAEDLGRHALALDVAGHFLLKTRDFAALRQEISRAATGGRGDPLGELAAGLEGQLPGGHEKSIVATLFQSVRLLGEEGLSLLRLAGELHGGTPIPFRLAGEVFRRAFALEEQAAGDYLTRAENQVEVHSLGTVAVGGEGSDAVSVHSLVRYTMLRADPEQDEAPRLRAKLRDAALPALGDLLQGVVDIRQHARLEMEIAHARHLVPQPRTADEARLSMWLARFEGERGNYREALTIESGVRPVLERVLGADHPVTLTTRNNIALWTGQTGEAREALRLFRELLPDRRRVLGADHPDTLTTRHNIACLTGEAGDGQ
jgi:hypothetical protein